MSTQYHWSPVDDLGAGRADRDARRARRASSWPRRWLARVGPGTAADLRWWTGWTGGQVKAALAALDAVAVDLDGDAGLVLADDAEPVDRARAVGGAAARPRPDDDGLGGPRRGTWARTARRCSTAPATPARPCGSTGGSSAAGRSAPDGAVVHRLLEKMSARRRAGAIERRADELAEWLGAGAGHAEVPHAAGEGAGRRLDRRRARAAQIAYAGSRSRLCRSRS